MTASLVPWMSSSEAILAALPAFLGSRAGVTLRGRPRALTGGGGGGGGDGSRALRKAAGVWPGRAALALGSGGGGGGNASGPWNAAVGLSGGGGGGGDGEDGHHGASASAPQSRAQRQGAGVVGDVGVVGVMGGVGVAGPRFCAAMNCLGRAYLKAPDGCGAAAARGASALMGAADGGAAAPASWSRRARSCRSCSVSGSLWGEREDSWLNAGRRRPTAAPPPAAATLAGWDPGRGSASSVASFLRKSNENTI